MDEWHKAWMDHVEGRPNKIDLPPFPPESIQKITNNASGRHTMEAAWRMYKIFSEEINNYDLEKNVGPLTALDLGAGWGRITRLMMRDILPCNISAVDVEEKVVKAGMECLPDVTWKLIETGKPLPFEDNSFSVVLANSVLSHLDEKLHNEMISEVSRVLKPGGIFLGTTLSHRHYVLWGKEEAKRQWLGSIFNDFDDIPARLENHEFVYGHTKRWEGYGITFLPKTWTQSNWQPSLNVRNVRTDYTQDVNVAQKV